MDTAVAAPRVMPDPLRGFGASAPKAEKVLDDEYLSMLIEDGLNSESVSFEELINVLSQHIGTHTPKNVRPLYDEDFTSLIEEIHAGKLPSASRKEVLMAIASGNISPEVVEDLEDAILLKSMEEAYNSERVSREEVMKSLKR